MTRSLEDVQALAERIAPGTFRKFEHDEAGVELLVELLEKLVDRIEEIENEAHNIRALGGF